MDMGAGKEAAAERGYNSGRAFTFVRVEESWSRGEESVEKEQQKTEKDGSLEAGSSRRCWKGLHWSARGPGWPRTLA